jgi:hypothetical protein
LSNSSLNGDGSDAIGAPILEGANPWVDEADCRELARPAIVEGLCDRSMAIEVVDDGARDDHRHRGSLGARHPYVVWLLVVSLQSCMYP